MCSNKRRGVVWWCMLFFFNPFDKFTQVSFVNGLYTAHALATAPLVIWNSRQENAPRRFSGAAAGIFGWGAPLLVLCLPQGMEEEGGAGKKKCLPQPLRECRWCETFEIRRMGKPWVVHERLRAT